MLDEKARAFELGAARAMSEDRGMHGARPEEREVRVPIAPCPPVPFVGLGRSSPDAARPARDRSKRRRQFVIAFGLLAIAALGAFLAAGGQVKAFGPLNGDTVRSSSVVERVIAPERKVDRHAANPAAVRSDDDGGASSGRKHRHGRDGTTGSEDGTGGSGHPGQDGGSGGSDGGGPSTPIATVNLPVVGAVTVEEPQLPPPPDADVPLPDLSAAPELPSKLP
jgi:hypothetical protein